MKKSLILTTLILLSIGLFSCNKEDDIIDTDDDSTIIQQEPTAEGIYKPLMRISQISGDYFNETWNWSTDNLTAICGNHIRYDLSYEGERLNQVEVNGTQEHNIYDDIINMTTNYVYNGTLQTQIIQKINDVDIATFTVQHNANNKINDVNIDIDTNFLSEYIEDIIENLIENRTSIKLNTTKNGEKYNVSNSQANSHLEWTGNNLTQLSFTIAGDIIITVGEIQELLNTIGSEHLGNLAEIADKINLLNPDRKIPITVGLHDTIDYTFDNKNNPYYGLLYYQLNAKERGLQGLSQNNILSYSSNGVFYVSFQIEILPGISGEPHTYSIPMLPINRTYKYQYNNKGFPTKITDNFGSTYITYSE